MEGLSVPQPSPIEFTRENYDALFAAGVDTPIGHVKMSDNQFEKFSDKLRDRQLAMADATLKRPNAIVSVPSQAKEGQKTERPSSYIFVKTFDKPRKNSEETRILFYNSVSVKKDGLEVVMSNYDTTRSRVKGYMEKGKLTYLNSVALSSESGDSIQGDQFAIPAGDDFSKGKDSNFPVPGNDYTEKQREKYKAQDVLGSPTPEITDTLQDATEGTVLFSVKGKKGEEKTLVGIHNISAEKLGKAIRMGGLANPSAAVIDLSHQDHFIYGEISLVMPSSLVDAKTGRNIGTFDRDAWTPTYPNVEYFSTKETDKRLKALTSELPEELAREIRRNVNMYMDGDVYNTGLEYLFLKDKGEEIGIQHTPRRYPYLTVKAIWEKLGVPEDTHHHEHEKWFTAYEELPEEQRKDFNAFYYAENDPAKYEMREKRGEKNANYENWWDE